jgi:hypothetical protein
MEETNLKIMQPAMHPMRTIEELAYPGQNPKHRMYQHGFEKFFEALPYNPVNNKDKFTTVMDSLAKELINYPMDTVADGLFERTIIGIEEFIGNKEPREIVLANWGKGFKSPVHGHKSGALYEKLIRGKMLVHTYRVTDFERRLAVPHETSIFEGFKEIITAFTNDLEELYPRSWFVHSFEVLEPSLSVHYVPEHTRDGRDNKFHISYFENVFNLEGHLEQIDTKQGLSLKLGDVCLVRSENVPDYGDHYIVITGKPVMKPWGLRPQDKVVMAPHAAKLIDNFTPYNGVTLLKLDAEMNNIFHHFHKTF